MIPIVIPSYEPDDRLIILLKELLEAKLKPIIIVNDGSNKEYDKYFIEAKSILKNDGIILEHNINLGKGRALKDAFSYITYKYPKSLGCVTVDSDGQHTVNSINKCLKDFNKHNDSLILGVRDFELDNVPERSKFGNKTTIKVMKRLFDIDISDTQTGLRVIPFNFMKEIINLPGDRFEYETQMLIETKNKVNIREVKIETVYDSKTNHSTHFNTISDSYKIYSIFIKYLFKKKR